MPLKVTAGPDLELRWRTPELHAIDQPIVIAGLAIAVVVERQQLFVVAVDPATGEKRWQQETAQGGAPGGTQVRPIQLGDDKVAYLQPAHRDSLYPYAELVIADVHTGRVLAKSPAALFSSSPIACRHGTAVCITTEEWNTDRREHNRLELATGAYVMDNHNIPLRARLMSEAGFELFDLADDPDNTLGLLRDGRLAWHLRFREAFPRALSSRYGWSWHLYGDHKVVVGSIFGGHVDTGRWVHVLATDNATVGLSEATGRVLWRNLGSSFHCMIGNGDQPVRCRSRGTVTYQLNGPTAFGDVAVTVEGFDPVTGQTTWSVPVGRAEDLVGGEHPPAIAGATKVAIARPGRWLVLDYATGAAAPAAPDASFWCMAKARYAYPPLWYRGVQWGADQWPGGNLAFICDGRGQPGAVLPSADATFAAGAQSGSYAVLATRDGLVGFERRAAPTGEPATPTVEPATPVEPTTPAAPAAPTTPTATPAAPAAPSTGN